MVTREAGAGHPLDGAILFGLDFGLDGAIPFWASRGAGSGQIVAPDGTVWHHMAP